MSNPRLENASPLEALEAGMGEPKKIDRVKGWHQGFIEFMVADDYDELAVKATLNGSYDYPRIGSAMSAYESGWQDAIAQLGGTH